MYVEKVIPTKIHNQLLTVVGTGLVLGSRGENKQGRTLFSPLYFPTFSTACKNVCIT